MCAPDDSGSFRLMRLDELRDRLLVRREALTPAVRKALEDDPRVGARRILAARDRRDRVDSERTARCRALARFDAELGQEGLLAGVDEAGMSPWAGPVVAAAVILPPDAELEGVDDSKRLTELQRETLAETIKGTAIAWSVAGASPDDVARRNVHHAGLLAMRRAVASLRPRPQRLVVDARVVPGFDGAQSAFVKADGKSLSVAAASVLAKTTRDRLMRRLDALFPQYGLGRHKGYGVPEHREALSLHGPCPHHRLCFDAVRAALSSPA